MKKLLFILFCILGAIGEMRADAYFLDYRDEENYQLRCGEFEIDGIIYSLIFHHTTATNGMAGPRASLYKLTDEGKAMTEINLPDKIKCYVNVKECLDQIGLPYRLIVGGSEISEWPLEQMISRAFTEDCAVEDITLPASIKYFGKGIFNGCPNLKHVTINSLPYANILPSEIFENCHINRVDVNPSIVYTQPMNAPTATIDEIRFNNRVTFNGANLASPQPKCIYINGYFAFSWSTIDAEKVVISGRDQTIVDDIGPNGDFGDLGSAFEESALCHVKELWLYVRTPPTCKDGDDIFSYVRSAQREGEPDNRLDDIKLYVPSSTVDAYRNHPVWGQIKNIGLIEDGVSDISTDASPVKEIRTYDLTGRECVNPRPGSMVIERRIATDGTVTTTKRVIPMR